MICIKDKGRVKLFKSEAKKPKFAYKLLVDNKETNYASYKDYLEGRPIRK